MAEYRAYEIGKDGHIRPSRGFVCNDERMPKSGPASLSMAMISSYGAANAS
jgi:hypothetical protein